MAGIQQVEQTELPLNSLKRADKIFSFRFQNNLLCVEQKSFVLNASLGEKMRSFLAKTLAQPTLVIFYLHLLAYSI